MIHENILGTIGKTPIVRIQRLGPRHVTLYVKCEFFNPLASVKDRLAIAIIEDAERRGTIKPGQTVVEATSGNTGIALAMVCAAKGYPFVAVMSETFSVERRRLMRFLGASVILTPAAERGSGMVRKAEELAKKHGWFLARQFENEANPAYHRNTTGPEILQDFAGKRLDYFVTGWGTGGTLTGAGQMIRLARPDVEIVACEPQGAALLSGKPWAPHKIQGWTPDFVPEVLDRAVAHRIVTVTDAEAVENARALARSEGILCGISSGATFAAALKVAAEAPQGAVLLAMLPDTGERYLSTILFEGIPEGSDPEP
ncbi:MAG TPA: cysteine synthase A [Steroidobacteraceae bacterium]|jgi:cysteine synthase A|nr:cysteine synthase A [Steroidobacteraceae bacterium]